MSLVVDFDYRFYTGTGVSAAVNIIGSGQIALGGHVYKIDTQSGEWAHQSIPRLKPQQDVASESGEGSLNSEGLWRRSQESWHHGAGQSRLDKADSDPFRFESSKGINVFDRWSLSLLPDARLQLSSTDTNIKLLTVGNYLYWTSGTNLRFTADGMNAQLSDIKGADPPATLTDIATDGNKIYASAAFGIHRADRGVSGSTGVIHYNDLVADHLDYVNGRLMASSGASIYNVTAAGAAPTALFAHPNSDFAWVGFAAGKRHIFAAGYSGDKSLIYKTTLTPEGAALTAPVVCGELPDGEVVRSIYTYLGYMFLGTDKGVRFAEVSVDGDLNIGALIPTANPVRCFEGQDQFVWFGWTNYDSVSTGLGRLDLRSFTAALAPAYASDIMATGQGTVTSIATFDNNRWFAADALGLYSESTAGIDVDSVSTGTGYLRTGKMSFGLSEQKVAQFVDVRYDSLTGIVATSISRDNTTFIPIGSHSPTTSTDQLGAGSLIGDSFNLRFDFMPPDGQNLLYQNQASFERSLIGWQAETNCTVAQVATFAADGTKSMEMTATAPGTMTATTWTGVSATPILPGRIYTAIAELRPNSTARGVRLHINWYTATGAFAAYSPANNITEVSGVFTQASVTGTAPANAAFASVVVVVDGNAAGEKHFVDKASIHQGTSLTWALPPAVSVSAELSRYTLKAEVVTPQSNVIMVPIIFASTLDVDGDSVPMNVAEELAYLLGLNATRTSVTYQEGSASYLVILDDYRYTAMKFSAEEPFEPEGTFLAKLRVLSTV